ncbi:hypothetical protein CSIM01_07396 [Colletotrichum simmondsii]|uniref:DUF7587 domain-containing protein n=1 Tax=Colletotrichum simmondsii TaxID=703756 RepID=A0A135TQ49_9PEZI|nr:hypothetical protein CSIM01_07396 [Colletotrichum simmondsii]
MATEIDSAPTQRISRGCVRFTPGPSYGDATSALKKIPRYLFRVHAPSTSGETSLKSVVSRAALCGHAGFDCDIFSMPPDEAAEMLNRHPRGWARDGDNLMSWTSSLLFALQYALYRSIVSKGGRLDEPSDIRIYVLDTSLLPEGSFIPDIALLDAFTGKDAARTVCKLRVQYFASPPPATKADFRFASAIAQGCFGDEDEWALPMTAALLSLRKRAINDIVIINGFKALFSDQEICVHNLDTFKTFPLDTHPEIHQFSKIIQDLHSDYCTRALDSVLATAAKLSLISF